MTTTAFRPPSRSARASHTPALDLHLLDDRHRFRMLQIAHGGSVLIIDDSGLIRHAGSTVHTAPPRPLLGEPILSLLHHQDMLNTLVVLDRARSGKEPLVSCVTRLRVDGHWEWFKATAARFGSRHNEENVTALFLKPLHGA